MTQLRYRDAVLEDLVNIVEIYNSTVASRMVTAGTKTVSVKGKQRWFDEHSPDKRPIWILGLGHTSQFCPARWRGMGVENSWKEYRIEKQVN